MEELKVYPYFYEPAEYQPCYYCKKIAHVEQEEYPIREGIYTHEKLIYRCEWHARFECSQCGESYHFNWLYWCPSNNKLVCGNCNNPTLKPVAFWDNTYSYQFFCEICKDYHFDLFYSEFQGKHPWQNGFLEIKSSIKSSKKHDPIWGPNKKRDGREIPLEQALQTRNRVYALRKYLKHRFRLRGKGPVPEDEIEFETEKESWVKNSPSWLEAIAKGDPNRPLLIDPALWKLIGEVQGLTVLDAGCGNGYLTRELARKGAISIGVDFSGPFIEYCLKQEKETRLGCQYLEASITKLSEFESNYFDLIVSNVVMVDVADVKQAFKELNRVLKDKGRFIWSNTHPVFGRLGAMDLHIPIDSQRNEERQLKWVDRYFDSGGVQTEWWSAPTWQMERTLEEYTKALKESGFVISEIVEPRPTQEIMQQYPRFFAFDADRWTHFIIFECLKR
ncbi:MAG: class I SAM-dependent methyltransferase [Promethearchaeota archaeon]